MNHQELLSTQEAEDFLNSLSPPPSNDTPSISETPNTSKLIQKNQDIINAADTLIYTRIHSKDSSLKLAEVIQAKSEAFRQIRILEWQEDTQLDLKKLIPTQIQIQIINNN